MDPVETLAVTRNSPCAQRPYDAQGRQCPEARDVRLGRVHDGPGRVGIVDGSHEVTDRHVCEACSRTVERPTRDASRDLEGREGPKACDVGLGRLCDNQGSLHVCDCISLGRKRPRDGERREGPKGRDVHLGRVCDDPRRVGIVDGAHEVRDGHTRQARPGPVERTGRHAARDAQRGQGPEARDVGLEGLAHNECHVCVRHIAHEACALNITKRVTLTHEEGSRDVSA